MQRKIKHLNRNITIKKNNQTPDQYILVVVLGRFEIQHIYDYQFYWTNKNKDRQMIVVNKMMENLEVINTSKSSSKKYKSPQRVGSLDLRILFLRFLLLFPNFITRRIATNFQPQAVFYHFQKHRQVDPIQAAVGFYHFHHC